jgi:Leucine-rich repeat (LRR) protein
MKKKLLLIIFLCISFSFYAKETTNGKRHAGIHKKTGNNSANPTTVETQNSGYTSIPDPNFEAALSTYDDIPNDGQVPTANIETITTLDVQNAGITDLTGIADFRDMTHLVVNDNSISTIDASNNTNLTFINGRNNGLTTLNVNGCTALGTLFIENNNLTTLDLSTNSQLIVLYAQENNFSSFDVTNNPLLKILAVTDSNLSSVDVTNNTALEILWVQRNNITEIDVSTAPNLRQLLAQRNNLRILNVKNGNNTNITNFNVGNNPNLTCIEVDDVAYSNANWTISSQMFFTETSCYTQIPDANFEAALSAYDDIPGDGQVPTALIENITTLNVAYSITFDISDLTGIQAFTALEEIYLGGNSISTLDLTSNTNLKIVECQANGLSTINITGLIELEELDISFNSCSSLDVSTNTKLTKIHCNDTGLSTPLDVSMLPLLVDLDCGFNFFNSLNVRNGNNSNFTNFEARNNPNLTCILVDDAAFAETNFTNVDTIASFTSTNYCDYTAIPDTNFEAALEALGYDDISGDGQVPTALIENVTMLNVSSLSISDVTGIEDFTALENFNCRANSISSVDVSNNINLKIFDIRINQLTNLDVSALVNLEQLYVQQNNLTNINMPNSVALQVFACNINNLTNIDVSNNVNLRELFMQGNQITSIDITNLPALKEFFAFNNSLATIDITTNVDLETLDVTNTNLTSLDISNNPLLTRVAASNNNLTSFVLGDNTALSQLFLRNNDLTALNLSGLTGLTSLDVRSNNLSDLNIQNGTNTIITNFQATDNPNLTCITVDDVAYSTANWTTIDAQTSFGNIYCRYTAIPDANFESALNSLGYDDISGDGQVPTALIEVVTNLDIPSLSIADLTGIEDFTALTFLNVNNNSLTNLDVTNLVNLEGLLISTNNLATIDLSTLTQLTRFQGRFNTYTSLDFSNNLLLDDLNVDNNPNLTTLNISQNTLLQFIDISDCAIANLDFSGLMNLLELDASNNLLTTVDFTDNIQLTDVYLSGNPVTMVNVSNLSSLQYFDAFDAQLTSLNIKNGNNVNLQYFNVTNNPNLTCIVVDDMAYAQTNLTNVDAQITFNEIDCIAPQITCPADIIADSEVGICGANISIPVPVVVDDVDCVQSDNLESYTEGLLLGQSDNWDTWTPNVQEQSGNISNEQARSGSKSLKMEGISDGGPQDMVFKLGDRASGAWELTYHLYVPTGNSAYSNIQKTEVAGTEFASQVYFHSDGSGLYNINGTLTDFNYPQDTWFEVKILINIDGDYSEFFVDGTFVNSHPFSYTTGSSNGLNTLGSVTFYPTTRGASDPNPDAIPLFYVDDLSLCAVAVNDFNNSTDASDVYPVGTTDIIWSYTDEGGNTATCTQVVTITDVEAPEVFRCAENMTVACDEVVIYETPLAVDSCEDVAIAGFTYLGGFEGKRYYLSNSNFNGPNAIIDAEAQNGFVAEIISQAHNDWLRTRLDELGEGLVLIGYSDNVTEGTFEWHNGSTNTYTNWNTNEPNNTGGNEDYTEMLANGLWNDTNTNASKKYILEIAGTPMTQTAGLPSGSVFPVGTTTNTFEATDAAGNITICSFDVVVEECSFDFTLDVKVFLQGAALNPNVGEETLMRDDLRVAGLLPTTSPYDGADSAPTAFDATGNDAIVDWIWVELRDQNDPTIVVEGRSYLVQRDGDIVARDGISILSYDMMESDTYYIAIKHRNHLGIMSNTEFTFNATNSIDFTASNAVVNFGNNAQTTSGMPAGVVAMWSGNANSDTVVQYSGTSPDTPNILSEVLNDSGNFLNFPTYSITGYNANDVNMDGVIQYSGTNPDTPFILQNVLASPANFFGFSTFSILEQLPENLLNQ